MYPFAYSRTQRWTDTWSYLVPDTFSNAIAYTRPNTSRTYLSGTYAGAHTCAYTRTKC